MKLSNFKSLVKTCLCEVNSELTKTGKPIFSIGSPGSPKRQISILDPTKEEMMEYLKSQYGSEPGWMDEAEEAIYWFANWNHGGQWSNLYSVLSTSPFSPGPISRGPEKGSMAEMMEQDLESNYSKSDGSVKESSESQATFASLPEGSFFTIPGYDTVFKKHSDTHAVVIGNGFSNRPVKLARKNQKIRISDPGIIVRHELSENIEPYDPETDTVAAGPRDRTEDWLPGLDGAKLGIVEYPESIIKRHVIDGQTRWLVYSSSDPHALIIGWGKSSEDAIHNAKTTAKYIKQGGVGHTGELKENLIQSPPVNIPEDELLIWAKQRLQREGNRLNRDTLDRLIKMLERELVDKNTWVK